MGNSVKPQINVGIIGCGMITIKRHAPEYSDNSDCRIIGFYDFDKERAGDMALRYHAKAYDTAEDLLTDDRIDAVSVCSPNYTHAEFAVRALKEGKHVLCEKPMALTAKAAGIMTEVSKQTGKILMIGYNQRLNRTHRTAKKLLDQGIIGRILTVSSNFKHPGPEYWSIDRKNSTWFFDKQKAQFGVLGDLGTHKFDVISYLTGSRIKEICCDTATLDKRYQDGRFIDLEDNATGMIRLENQIMGTFHFSWTNYGSEDSSTVVYGDKGVMRIFDDKVNDIIVEQRNGTRICYQIERMSTNESQLKSGVIDEFISSIAENRSPAVTAEDGLYSLYVLEAAAASSSGHCWVQVG